MKARDLAALRERLSARLRDLDSGVESASIGPQDAPETAEVGRPRGPQIPDAIRFEQENFGWFHAQPPHQGFAIDSRARGRSTVVRPPSR